MLSDLALKIAVVFMVIFGSFYMWYQSEGDEGVKEELKANVTSMLPVNISGFLEESGFGKLGYCPYINPYMSQLFSAGSLEVGPGNPLHEPLNSIVGGGCADKGISALFDYESEGYVISCDGGSASLDTDALAESLNTYVEDTGFSLKQKIPAWQCFLFFGVLPFVAMFFFLRDILGFSMLSPKLKTLIVVFASTLAIMTGAFAKFVWQLAYVASMSVQATFLIVMLVLAFSSVIISWVGSFNLAVGKAREEAAQVSAGLAQKYTFEAMAGVFRKKK